MATRAKIAHARENSHDRHARSWTAVVMGGIAAGFALLISLGRVRLFDRGEPQNDSVARERLESGNMSNISEPGGLAVGSYTRETIPQPSADTAEYLTTLKKYAEQIRRLREQDEAVGTLGLSGDSFVPIDDGQPMIVPTDPGKPLVGVT